MFKMSVFENLADLENLENSHSDLENFENANFFQFDLENLEKSIFLVPDFLNPFFLFCC